MNIDIEDDEDTLDTDDDGDCYGRAPDEPPYDPDDFFMEQIYGDIRTDTAEDDDL